MNTGICRKWARPLIFLCILSTLHFGNQLASYKYLELECVQENKTGILFVVFGLYRATVQLLLRLI